MVAPARDRARRIGWRRSQSCCSIAFTTPKRAWNLVTSAAAAAADAGMVPTRTDAVAGRFRISLICLTISATTSGEVYSAVIVLSMGVTLLLTPPMMALSSFCATVTSEAGAPVRAVPTFSSAANQENDIGVFLCLVCRPELIGGIGR